MNNMKKVKALLLAVLMLLAVMLSACGGQGGTEASENGKVAYKVTVTDAVGNPYTSGMVVKFMQNGVQAGMQVVNEKGEAVKELAKGDYTVELQFTDSEAAYTCDTTDLTLSAEKTELTILLSRGMSQETRDLVVGNKTHAAHYVQTGCTKVALNEEGRTYFLFAPTEPGLYEFSVVGSDAAIGYYGAPHFVQENSATEVVDNKFTMSIRKSMIGDDNSTGSFVLVIGLDAAQGDTSLSIQRIGEPEWSVEDEPWIIYKATVALAPYTLPDGAKLQKFDLTAPTEQYTLVLNETDGFYHLDSADGALVLVQLGQTEEKTDYLDPFEAILDRSGVSRYFFDEDGKFIKKESYSECLLEYIANMDEEKGVYPLTEDLKYIIQQRGEHSGWWDPESSLYLFVDDNGMAIPGINNEIAWLFMCRFMEK